MLINSGSQTSSNDESPLLHTDYRDMNNTAAIYPDNVTDTTYGHNSSPELVDDALKSNEGANTAAAEEMEQNEDVLGHTLKSFPYKKIVLGSIIVAVIVIIIVDSLTSKRIQSAFQSFLEWTADNIVVGFFAFIAVYAIATVLFIPGSILTLGSGFIFGNAVGNLGLGMVIASGAVFIGASSGAVGSFLIGRYLARDWVGRVLVQKYPLIRALDGALERKGFRIFLLLRLSPVIPFNAINYIAGVTAVSLKEYTLSLIGILPGTVVYCFIGAGAGSLAEGQNAASGNRTLTIVSIVIGIVFGLLAVFAVSYYAKKEFNAIVATEAEKQSGEQGDQSNNSSEDDGGNAIAFEDEESHGVCNDEQQNADMYIM